MKRIKIGIFICLVSILLIAGCTETTTDTGSNGVSESWITLTMDPYVVSKTDTSVISGEVGGSASTVTLDIYRLGDEDWANDEGVIGPALTKAFNGDPAYPHWEFTVPVQNGKYAQTIDAASFAEPSKGYYVAIAGLPDGKSTKMSFLID